MIRIFIQGAPIPKLLDWKWCKRNVNKIANNFDAEIERFEKTSAILRDRCLGRLILIDTVSKRLLNQYYDEKNIQPLPWKHDTENNSSAIIDNNRKVVCGSYLRSVNKTEKANHDLIEKAVKFYTEYHKKTDIGI